MFRLPGLGYLSDAGAKLYNAGAQVVSSVASGTSAIVSGTVTAISNAPAALSNTATQTKNYATAKLQNTASAISSTAAVASATVSSTAAQAKNYATAKLQNATAAGQNYAKKTLSDIASYQPNYRPPGEIVEAATALNRYQKSDKANERKAKEDALTALQKLAEWLRKPEQKGLFPADFLKEIEEVLKVLGKPGGLHFFKSAEEAKLFKDRFAFVCKEVNYWAKSSIVNRMTRGEVLPPLDSPEMSTLKKAFEHCIALRESLTALNNEEAKALAPQFVGYLKGLIQALQSGNLPPKFVKNAQQKLSAELTCLQNVISKGWHKNTPSREKAIQITDRLVEILSGLVNSCAKTSSQVDLLAKAAVVNGRKVIDEGCALLSVFSESPEGDVPTAMHADFKELLEKLTTLNHAIRKNPDDILNSTRSTYAFLKAMLKRKEGEEDEDLANYYKIPVQTIKALAYFSDALEELLSTIN